MSWDKFDRKKFAVILFVGVVILFSTFFYFHGREMDYTTGYNLATQNCNAYLNTLFCQPKNATASQLIFNAPNYTFVR